MTKNYLHIFWDLHATICSTVSCHPYVYEMAEKEVISHTLLEKEFDRTLMLETGKNPYRYYPSCGSYTTHHLCMRDSQGNSEDPYPRDPHFSETHETNHQLPCL